MSEEEAKKVDWMSIIWKIIIVIPWKEILSAIFEAFKPTIVKKVADPDSKVSDVDLKALEDFNSRWLKK